MSQSNSEYHFRRKQNAALLNNFILNRVLFAIHKQCKDLYKVDFLNMLVCLYVLCLTNITYREESNQNHIFT